jgi:Protein of unknown function (DUF4056)
MNRNISIVRWSLRVGISMGLMTVAGCSLGGPRARLGTLPTATFGVSFANPNKLGHHAYGLFSFFEVSGIVYTCKGGDIDLDHIRGNADATHFLIKKIRTTLSKKRKGFSFNLGGEMSTHVIHFTYPDEWDRRPDKNKIIDDIAYSTAPYIAFQASTWHEIVTWFGTHFAGFEPEFNSAFSWEDSYSNLVGVRLGVEATKDTKHNYDDAMTIAIYRELKVLGVQPRSTAIAASKSVRGLWYTGNLVPDMKMRNFDIGLDGSVTPTLIPGVAACGPNPQPLTLPAPTLATLKRYGFSMTHEIKPNVLEQGRIFKAAGSKRIFPEKQFPILMAYIKKDARRRGYMYDE